MTNQSKYEGMNDMYIFETSQLIVQLEKIMLSCEETGSFGDDAIHEIFRIIHTVKGSSAMMMYENITNLSHGMEDLFYYLREDKPEDINCRLLTDLVLGSIDFIKVELEKIKSGASPDGDASGLIQSLLDFLSGLQKTSQKSNAQVQTASPELIQGYFVKEGEEITCLEHQYYKAVIYFMEGCEMENVRAFTVIHKLKNQVSEFSCFPEDLVHNDRAIDLIREEGFLIYFKSEHSYDHLFEFFCQTIFLKDVYLTQYDNEDEYEKELHRKNASNPEAAALPDGSKNAAGTEKKEGYVPAANVQNIISVNVNKLDKLIDLVGDMVIAEAMVIQNPELKGLELDGFHKAARQLNKITTELQDIVMSIRMIPLSATFQKMHRIVRDMCKKLGKEVKLEIVGEETEVDKNIIEHISDPLMHLVRNALDHGMEEPEERRLSGKERIGTITIEARNAGSDIIVIVKDDGRGLNKDKILKKAVENGLLVKKPEDMTEKEIFHLILLPGFSTKDSVTEFSGRGVGMDVVTKNIELVGGLISVDSLDGKGTSITIKMPLTLAIIDGMNIRVGHSYFTIPVISVLESFRPLEKDVIVDPDGNEMIMVRGRCYRLIKLWEEFHVRADSSSCLNGIIIMVEENEEVLCILADELIGKQQVVVKSLPRYIQNFRKTRNLAGCTLLGDGSISLILDIARLI